jgi:hypothetical protein
VDPDADARRCGQATLLPSPLDDDLLLDDALLDEVEESLFGALPALESVLGVEDSLATDSFAGLEDAVLDPERLSVL